MARAAKVEVLILLIHVCGCNLSLHERKDIFRGCTQSSVIFKSQVDKVLAALLLHLSDTEKLLVLTPKSVAERSKNFGIRQFPAVLSGFAPKNCFSCFFQILSDFRAKRRRRSVFLFGLTCQTGFFASAALLVHLFLPAMKRARQHRLNRLNRERRRERLLFQFVLTVIHS